jgi:hypothetical protein
MQNDGVDQQANQSEQLGVPPDQFHPQRPDAPVKKGGNLKLALLVALAIVVIDLLIYFFLIKPDDASLLKAIEPLKPK